MSGIKVGGYGPGGFGPIHRARPASTAVSWSASVRAWSSAGA